MIIEIHGAGFQNKGAELMLRTTVAELQKRLPQLVPAVDPTYGPYNQRSKLALYQIIPPRTHVGTSGFAKRFYKQRLFSSAGGERLFRYITGTRLDMYGCVSLARVQGLIDVAGFAYTDEWGSQPTQDLALLTQYYKSVGKPVILLPQAFGPFEKYETKRAFEKVVENASLVFARDQRSYDYILEISPSSGKLYKAPDITLFYPEVSSVASVDEEKNHYVCMVPNIRMLDQGKQDWATKYESYMLAIARELKRCGIHIKLVVHDVSGHDLKLAQEIYSELSLSDVTLVESAL